MQKKLTLAVITGLSGAGKTKAMGFLEDANFFCVDNLPPLLMEPFLNLCLKTEGRIDKIGLAVDVRGRDFLDDFNIALEKIKNMPIDYKIIFLEASNETLIRRFSETRRKHPIGGSSVLESLEDEKNLLKNIRDFADIIIDTSDFKLQDLKEKINSVFPDVIKNKLILNIVSFGYKFGLPLDADMVFDLRFLPNPYYEESLSGKTGVDQEVKKFVLRENVSKEFLEKLKSIMNFLIPYFIKEGKSYLTLAFGCTGGKHRSVVVAEWVVENIKKKNVILRVSHRDKDK